MVNQPSVTQEFSQTEQLQHQIEELTRQVRARERLVEAVRALSMAKDLKTVMEIVRTAARELTGADGATFIFKDGDHCFYADEDAIGPLWKGQRFPMKACISGWVMLHKQAAVIEDINEDDRIPKEAYRPTFVKSLAMVPIRSEDPIAAIGNYWATRRMPTQEEVTLLQSLADATAVVIGNLDAEDAVNKSEKTFRIFANNIQNLAWMAEPDGWIFWYNQQWYDYTGTTFEEMQGWGWEKVHHPDHIDRVVAFVKEAWGKGETWELTFPLKGADGEYRWFLTRAAAVKDENGKVIRWIGTNTNIDAQKRAEEELLNYTRRLAQSNKELEDFATIASHDLQAPLRKVITFGDILQQTAGDQLSEEALDCIHRIQSSSAKMQDLIKDLLALSRITRKANPFEPTDLNEVVADVLEDLDVTIAETQATVTVDDLCTVEADSSQMKQVFYQPAWQRSQILPARCTTGDCGKLNR